MLDSPVPEPLSPVVVRAQCVSSDVRGVDGAEITFVVRSVWFVVPSNLRVDVSSNQRVCVVVFLHLSVFVKLRDNLLYVLFSVSRVWEVH